MWSKQNRMENSSHSDLLPPSLIYALDVGDPERAATPFRATCLRCGEVGDKGARCPASGPGMEGAAWAVPGSSAAPTLTPTYLLVRKAILLLSEIWFDIYIHKHIYQHLYLYSDSTKLEILLPRSVTSWSTSFG